MFILKGNASHNISLDVFQSSLWQNATIKTPLLPRFAAAALNQPAKLLTHVGISFIQLNERKVPSVAKGVNGRGHSASARAAAHLKQQTS